MQNADDAKIELNGSDTSALQQDLDMWEKELQMKFDADKCNVMHFSSKDSKQTLYSLGRALEVRNWI